MGRTSPRPPVPAGRLRASPSCRASRPTQASRRANPRLPPPRFWQSARYVSRKAAATPSTGVPRPGRSRSNDPTTVFATSRVGWCLQSSSPPRVPLTDSGRTTSRPRPKGFGSVFRPLASPVLSARRSRGPTRLRRPLSSASIRFRRMSAGRSRPGGRCSGWEAYRGGSSPLGIAVVGRGSRRMPGPHRGSFVPTRRARR